MYRRFSAALIAASMVLPQAAAAPEHVVAQKDKAFSVKTLKAKVGDTITFRNDDPFAHNIFSLSSIQSFDLGTFGKGETKQVVLKKEGKMDVECAIHPEMKLTVEVEK